jgi:hypothetical protein
MDRQDFVTHHWGIRNQRPKFEKPAKHGQHRARAVGGEGVERRPLEVGWRWNNGGEIAARSNRPKWNKPPPITRVSSTRMELAAKPSRDESLGRGFEVVE